MASLEIIALILTGFSITASILYYTSVLRNAEKTRRREQLFQRFQSIDTEWIKAWATVIYTDFENFEDWFQIYNPKTNPEGYAEWSLVAMRFELIGTMLKEGTIDAEMVFKIYSPWTLMRAYEKMSPMFVVAREARNMPKHREGFEFLYIEAKRMHPDIITEGQRL